MSPKYKSVTIHNGHYVWQLTVLGKPLRSKQHFETPVDAALDVDLVKHYVRTEYGLDLPASLDGEMFSNLAYSRRSVILSDSQAVLSALPDCAKQFIADNHDALTVYANEYRKPPADWEKLRSYDNAAIREWCNNCEAASLRANAFSAVNGEYLVTLLGSVSARLTACEGPLNRALKMYSRVEEPALARHRDRLLDLTATVASVAALVDSLNSQITKERAEVASALSVLESNRPPLL